MSLASRNLLFMLGDIDGSAALKKGTALWDSPAGSPYV